MSTTTRTWQHRLVCGNRCGRTLKWKKEKKKQAVFLARQDPQVIEGRIVVGASSASIQTASPAVSFWVGGEEGGGGDGCLFPLGRVGKVVGFVEFIIRSVEPVPGALRASSGIFMFCLLLSVLPLALHFEFSCFWFLFGWDAEEIPLGLNVSTVHGRMCILFHFLRVGAL